VEATAELAIMQLAELIRFISDLLGTESFANWVADGVSCI
jgi:hypothetical protein